MGFSTKTSIFVLALFAVAAQAHMRMLTPVPFGWSTLNSSPLDPSGSDFPCKQRAGVYEKEGAQNVMAIGAPQTLSFKGSAVHGGGSCQIALSTDLAPTKDSKWMVIKSIIGGCPANVKGNLPDDPEGEGASKFPFTIPEGIAPGEYTLSWSWFNKVGNREFYQNCAPVTVATGTASRRRRWESEKYAEAQLQARQASFPGLYVANLASVNTCTSPEGSEVVYANPGSEVQTAGDGPFTTLASNCEVGSGGGAAAPAQPTSAPANSGQPTYGSTATAGSPAGQPSGPPAGQPSGPPGGGYQDGQGKPSNAVAPTASAGSFAEGAASSASSSYQNQVIPVTTSILPAQTSAAPAADSRENNNTEGSTGQTGTCAEGAWSCSSDGHSFQRCASGSWSATIPMAAGMKCVPGISANFAQAPGKIKRHAHGGHVRFFDISR